MLVLKQVIIYFHFLYENRIGEFIFEKKNDNDLGQTKNK